MPDLADLTLPELADLLQEAYAAYQGMPEEQMTDPITRHDLAQLLDRDEALKAAVIEVWLENREAPEDNLMYWFDAKFLGALELPDREED